MPTTAMSIEEASNRDLLLMILKNQEALIRAQSEVAQLTVVGSKIITAYLERSKRKGASMPSKMPELPQPPRSNRRMKPPNSLSEHERV